MKKKVDPRVRTLIENGVALNQRTFFVLVGDRGKDQVVNLHYMLSRAQVKARPSVLWCYKKELGFTTCAVSLCLCVSLSLSCLIYTTRPGTSASA
jgi:N-acetyltransferase 10